MMVVLCVALFSAVDAKSAEHAYGQQTGLNATRKLGRDLYEHLKPKERAFVNLEPVSIETDLTPAVKLDQIETDAGKKMGIIFISAGFLDLMNNVAHAKAIDKVEKGYFEKYVLQLATESAEKGLQDLPKVEDDRFWTEDVLNEQVSNFNQMVGTVAAIKISHFYLEHYKKYEAKIHPASGPEVPVNKLLTAAEWEASLEAGVANALDCGFGVDGIKALFECIDKMPKRPAWTAFFMPDDSKIATAAKMKKTMEKMEKKFFGN